MIFPVSPRMILAVLALILLAAPPLRAFGADLAAPPVAGLAAGPARALAAAMAEALAAKGFRAKAGAGGGEDPAFSITGRAAVRRRGEATAWVALSWKVTAADGHAHDTAAREILVDQTRWAQGEALTMRYAAAETAGDVLKVLARLGVQPGPAPAAPVSAAPAAVPAAVPAAAAPVAAPVAAAETAAAVTAPAPAPWPGGEIPVFLVRLAEIKGAGVSGGGQSLALAMGRALRALGAETAPEGGAGASYVVRAEAEVSDPADGVRRMRIIWHVAQISSGASGKSLGTATQQHEVPAQAFEAWDALAEQIAAGAAEGVRRLFAVQPSAGQPQGG